MGYIFDSNNHFFELGNGSRLTCKIVKSSRAKRIILKIRPTAELEFVVPKGLRFSTQDMLEILENKACWIENAFERLMLRCKNLNTPLVLPDKIYLPALNEIWTIKTEDVVENSKDNFVKIEEYIESDLGIKQLVLAKNTDDIPILCKALQVWLHNYSKDYLSIHTHKIADLHGFKINKVAVKSHRTKWGSCSSQGNININFRLMLLDEKLIKYLILHELCHLEHMNHSISYKNFIRSLELNSKEYEKGLTVAWHKLPRWILA